MDALEEKGKLEILENDAMQKVFRFVHTHAGP